MKRGQPCIFNEELAIEDRTVRGRLIEHVIRQHRLPDGSKLLSLPNRIILSQALILGRLDLASYQCASALFFTECLFDAQPDFSFSSFPYLALTDTIFLDGALFIGVCVQGNLNLDDSIFNNCINLSGSKIDGQFSATHGVFENHDGNVLLAQRATIKGGVFLDGIHTIGEVSFSSANIYGSFSADNATMNNSEQTCLWLANAIIQGAVSLNNGIFLGAVNLSYATIHSLLYAENTRFFYKNGICLNAQNTTIKGGVRLHEIKAQGGVDFSSATIHGQFSADSSHFISPNENCFRAQGTKITDGMFLTESAFIGRVSLSSIAVSGQVSLMKSTFSHPKKTCIFAQRAHFDGNVFCTKIATCGRISFSGATIEGTITFDGAHLINTHGPAIVFNAVKIKRDLKTTKLKYVPIGGITLESAQIETIWDDDTSFSSAPLRLDGIKYTRFHSQANKSYEHRIHWLKQQSKKDLGVDFKPQPWKQCAKVLRDMGHDRDARKVLLEMEILRTKAVGKKRFWWRQWRKVLHWVTGYGLEPWRAVYWVIGAWLLGALIFYNAGNNGNMLPAKERFYLSPAYENYKKNIIPLPAEYPKFQALTYSADVFLPIVDLGQETHWRPANTDHWFNKVRWYNRLHILLGWLLSTIAILGFTGVIKDKDV